jgi:hypothetical protein
MTLGRENAAEDVDLVLQILPSIVEELRTGVPALS